MAHELGHNFGMEHDRSSKYNPGTEYMLHSNVCESALRLYHHFVISGRNLFGRRVLSQ